MLSIQKFIYSIMESFFSGGAVDELIKSYECAERKMWLKSSELTMKPG